MATSYAVCSAFAGNELLISLELLVDENLLEITVFEKQPFKKNFVDYNSVVILKCLFRLLWLY